ncbi:asparagine synthase (glutamine-hydrolyzing) [Gammaproteobacteria bacterium]|nr:asparagine synthase (glutamine-hydrolyzing) [Gammaproteobacteria bacterium]
MCGIIGLSVDLKKEKEICFEYQSKLKECFNKSNAMLSHRGPDASGSEFFFDKGVSLGHTRLAIQDLSSAGAQPMTSEDGALTISFNGEIYNFPLLKKALIKKGYKFFSNTDTEVILNLYAEYGLDLFPKLDGIFALAIYDKKKNQLIVSRDGLGVKPLYYYSDESSFAFSSEIKALEMLLVDKNLTIDPGSINRYLTFQWCPGDGTPYAEIKKNNPGEVLVIQNGSVIDKRVFYKLPLIKNIKKNNTDTVDTIVNELDGKLRTAVHDQMLSDAPVGAFLSGGLDSTSVVAFAKELDPNIVCFTIENLSSSNDGIEDDLPYAKEAAKHLNVPLEVVTVDANSIVTNLEKMIWMLDEPLGDPAPLNVLYISELAKENGIKVLLSGAGGDDIFTGYRRHQGLIFDEKIKTLPKSILSSFERLSGRLDNRVTLFRRLAKLFNGVSLDGNDRIINYNKWIGQKDLSLLYSDAFREEIACDLAEQPILDFFNMARSDATALDKMLGFDQRFFTTDHNLTYTDKMSMAAGVEVRVPLLARDLVDYAATIPDNIKQNGRVGKWIFKKTMEPYLPKEIIYRPKTGFGAPLREWLKYDLRDYVEDLLGHDSLSSRGLFDPERVSRLIKNNSSGRIDASYTIFSLICVELWCRQHLDRRPKSNSGPSFF